MNKNKCVFPQTVLFIKPSLKVKELKGKNLPFLNGTASQIGMLKCINLILLRNLNETDEHETEE